MCVPCRGRRGRGACRVGTKLRLELSNTRFARFLLHPVTKVTLAVAVIGLVCGAGVFSYYYEKFARLIDRRLASGVFARTSKIYAAPELISIEQDAAADELAVRLRRAGYSENKTNRVGWYQEVPGGLEIFPGPDSYFQDEPVLIRLAGRKIQRIISLKDNSEQQGYELEPELITNLFDRSREKRRLVRFEDLPPDLVNAILAAEDRSFFQHPGFDFLRLIKVAYEDIRAGDRTAAGGASTLTQQTARLFFLTPVRTFRRKAAEALIALQLERRLTKQQIFEFYCNQIYMGQRGSFSIHGVEEASLVYFGKDVRQLTLPEAAFLAGFLRGPAVYDPYRHPERALERRNRILEAMAKIGAISPEQRDEAMETPLKVVPQFVETGDAPYFVDLVREQLLERFSEKELIGSSYRIYTTLDLSLQRAASEAVRAGIKLVDEQLAKKKSRQGWPKPQVALVAIDPHSGEVKALVGGRAYGVSQLNHAMAMRQPGSVFKPFVYAAAFNSALDGASPVITPVTVVDDSPTTFVYDGGIYEPNNYQEKFRGNVEAQDALAHSLNVATVKIGEMTGFDKVVKLAQDAGLKTPRATPSVALGSYESTPLEMSGAYTVFANGGLRVDPFMIRLIKTPEGQVAEEHKTQPREVIDARLAGLMTAMLENVVQRGTGAGVRARGFTAPAAGKTGTSHDGWFAGYTSNLLCIVWVGFDDNRELPLGGAASALPIWTEFMKRAAALRAYRNMVAFTEPPGLARVEIDPASNQLATAFCPERRPTVFVEGSQPGQLCPLHAMQYLARPNLPPPLMTGVAPAPGDGMASRALPPAAAASPGTVTALPPAAALPAAGAASPADAAKKKKGVLGRIFGALAGSGDKEPPKEKEKQKQP